MRIFTYKRITNYLTMLPITFLGSIFIVFVAFYMLEKSSALDILIVILVVQLLFSAFNIYQSISGDLLDEVYDDGDSLVLVSGGRCERILLNEIINVNCQVFFNSTKMTLTLSHTSRLGNKVSFTRSTDLLPVMSPKRIEEFILRVDEARRKA